MCVDDYQFRHYSANKQKLCRRFIITNEDEIEKTYLVNISQFQENGEVALCKILLHLESKGLQIHDRSFYLPKYDIFLQPNTHCKVPFDALNDKVIEFRSVKKNLLNHQDFQAQKPQKMSLENEQISVQPTAQAHNFQISGNSCQYCIGKIQQESDFDVRNLLQQPEQICSDEIQHLEYVKSNHYHVKRVKQPQRKIGQVIVAVKKWRKLYEAKKMKLTQSAKLIGISKKSLDDYFLVLRVGQILGFNYAQNLENKMGDLRTYIREVGCKISGKLGKQLKCFELVPPVDLDNVMEQQSRQNDGQDSEDQDKKETMEK